MRWWSAVVEEVRSKDGKKKVVADDKDGSHVVGAPQPGCGGGEEEEVR